VNGLVRSIVVDSGPLIALFGRLKVSTVASVDSNFTIYPTRDRRPFPNRFFEVSPPASSGR
jgi:hypothetical protein